MPEAVLQKGERNITGGREDNHASKPNFKTVEIPPIDIDSESKKEVVEQGQGRTSSDPVCWDRWSARNQKRVSHLGTHSKKTCLERSLGVGLEWTNQLLLT